MRNLIVGIVVGVVVGIVVGTTVVAPRLRLPVQTDAELRAKPPVTPHLPEPASHNADKAPTATPSAANGPRPTGAPRPAAKPATVTISRLRMASAYSASMAELGGLAKRLEQNIFAISDGALELKFFEPGTLVATDAALDALRSGAIEAVFATPGLWAERNSALYLFSGIPFGPAIQEYLAWLHADGRALMDDILEKLGVHGLVCGLLAPEGSGWFRQPVHTLEQLKGMRIGMTGLGGHVLKRLGATVSAVAEGDVFVALERGLIDGAAAAQPSIDLKLGLHRMARHYYFPGWHQPATPLTLLINLDTWKSLSEPARAQIETVCGDNVAAGLAQSEAGQFDALKALTVDGVQLQTWPPEIISALRAAWTDEVAALRTGNKDFAKAWDSLQQFREEYGIWREIGLPKIPR